MKDVSGKTCFIGSTFSLFISHLFEREKRISFAYPSFYGEI